MIFEHIKLKKYVDDDEFNTIYPEWVRKLAFRHWTSVQISKVAADFLVGKPGTKVLDIGSGPGKFCMIGASHTNGYFTGVEQRYSLVELSKKLSIFYSIQNVNYIHANITSINFKEYDAFYFFNSFYENIDRSAIIDETVNASIDLYDLYSIYVNDQFSLAPQGTRLVTYCGALKEIPSSYELQYSLYNGLLKFWKKTSL